MVLHPPSYSCPDDHSDLTGLVTEALSGQTASVTVTATAIGQVLASATVTPATDGTATRTLTVTGLPATEAVTVLARGGTEQCRSSLGTGSAPPTLSCGEAS